MEEKIYKIYCIKCPIDNTVKYIGITSLPLNVRKSQHIHKAKEVTDKKRPLYIWIEQLLLNNLTINLEILEIVDKDNYKEKEIYYIDLYSKNYNLLNIHKGGGGLVVGAYRQEINKNVIEAHKKPVCQFDMQGNLIKIWDCAKDVSIFYGHKSHSTVSNAASSTYRVVSCEKCKWQYYEDYIKGLPLKNHKKIGYMI